MIIPDYSCFFLIFSDYFFPVRQNDEGQKSIVCCLEAFWWDSGFLFLFGSFNAVFFMNVVPFDLQIRGPIYLAVFSFSRKIHVSKIIPVLRSSCSFLYSFTLLGNMSFINCINQVRQARRKIRRQRMREE